MYHCYLIPYIVKNNKIFTLIGKKKTYSKIDGYIHNNPGQWVYVGGHCRKSTDDKLIKSSMREFVEETGHYINTSNVFLKRFKNFSVTYYKVFSEHEFKSLSTIQKSKGLDKVHIEITQLKWMEINNVIELMHSKNKPFSNVHMYLSDWKKNNWQIDSELKKFKIFLEKKIKKKLSRKQYLDILQDIKSNLKKSIHYDHLYTHLQMYLKNRSYTDWYESIALFIKNNNSLIDKNIIADKSLTYEKYSKDFPKKRFETPKRSKSPDKPKLPRRRFFNSKKI